MADVFISYAHDDLHLARALAVDLTEKGYSAWWDYELLPGDRFHDALLAAIDDAKFVIVIWSDLAAASRWVREEADYAANLNKLITTHAPGFNAAKIPLGFKTFHAIDVTDRARIMATLERRGLKPSLRQTAVGEQDWLACFSGKPDAIIAACTRIIDDPKIQSDDAAKALVYRSRARIKNRAYEAAIADLTHALRLSPHDKSLLFARASAYSAAKNPDAAIDDLNAILASDPANVTALERREMQVPRG